MFLVCVLMKDIYELLRQKEQHLRQLQREVEALQIAAGLLAENDTPAPVATPLRAAGESAASPAPQPATPISAAANRWP
jgi:hypothetical protein